MLSIRAVVVLSWVSIARNLLSEADGVEAVFCLG